MAAKPIAPAKSSPPAKPSLAAMPCPACDEPVFDQGSVVLCSRCDAYQHLKCWTAAGRCAATQKCKGKPTPVAVVKLQPPGPSAAEIAAAVDAKTQELVHGVVADLRATMAHGEDLDAMRQEMQRAAESAQEKLEALRRETEARAEKLRQAIAAIDSRIASAPTPLDRGDLARTAAEIREGADGAVREASEAVETQLAEIRRGLAAQLHEVLIAVEACRWDTAARRNPMPWDARTDDVLESRSAGADAVQGGVS